MSNEGNLVNWKNESINTFNGQETKADESRSIIEIIEQEGASRDESTPIMNN